MHSRSAWTEAAYFSGDIGGRWFIAEEGGEIHATLWFFGEQPNVYIDYFAVKPSTGLGRIAGRLMAKTEAVLKAHGVRFVRAAIPKNNTTMRKLANRFGMCTALNYTNVFKEIT